MTDFAVSAKLSGKPSEQIITESAERFAQEGRRIGTEVDTALSIFDRTSERMLYKNAGVKKFVYWGPVDADNRDSCRAVLSDPRQTTGWTLADIQGFPNVDFDMGGYPYFNCRHKFMPFTGQVGEHMEEKVETGSKQWKD